MSYETVRRWVLKFGTIIARRLRQGRPRPLYRSQHELVFVFKHGRGSHQNNVQLGQYGRHRSNVWSYPGAN